MKMDRNTSASSNRDGDRMRVCVRLCAVKERCRCHCPSVEVEVEDEDFCGCLCAAYPLPGAALPTTHTRDIPHRFPPTESTAHVIVRFAIVRLLERPNSLGFSPVTC